MKHIRVDKLSQSLKNVLTEHRKLIVNNVINQVRRTEFEKEFPFNMLNDLRGYINYAPFYFASFAKVILNSNFNKIDSKKLTQAIGSPIRIKRYLLELVIGAFLNKEYSIHQKIYVLDKITSLMNQNLSKFYYFSKNKAKSFFGLCNFNVTITNQDKLNTSRLFITAREFIDFLFLGEHAIGYQPHPPQQIGKYDIIIREFFNLKYGEYFKLFNQMEIVDFYKAREYVFNFDLFRGKLSGIPPYHKKILCKFIISRKLHELPSISQIIEALNQGINKRREYYSKLSETEIELEKMILCSWELQNLHVLLNKKYVFPEEAKRSILQNKIAQSQKQALNLNYYTDLYFHLLKEAIDYFINSLENIGI